ncbi:glycosyltransferase [Adhaeribacter swui]|uniref:Glycosyltransferase n=1 Tax=Adhaeribacter swui TaxID=2086471 RepID=A0A7G7GAK1_9BACT|nr:glycosyltransferase [Adhaeribacter swui]QNF34185.1 glycosyltransferase [Adhaeribacter swui]
MVSEVSILIPVYNYHITTIVHQLQAQCQRAAIAYEIICLDDASNNGCKIGNQKVKFLKNVIYEELPVNISRAAIRNVLARKARYAYLLFLDNDSQIISEEFIATYLQAAKPDTVYVGGTVYQPEPPAPEYRLHWYYGQKREQRPAVIRQQNPYQQIQVNNLFVSRALYLANPLPEVFASYGHEDTLWGTHLAKAKIPVWHLDNPVCHAGLVSTANFLLKTEQAVNNLVLLNQSGQVVSSSLIRTYRFLKKVKAVNLFRWIFVKVQSLLLVRLRSACPSLVLLDMYKLGLFVNAIQKTQKQNF